MDCQFPLSQQKRDCEVGQLGVECSSVHSSQIRGLERECRRTTGTYNCLLVWRLMGLNSVGYNRHCKTWPKTIASHHDTLCTNAHNNPKLRDPILVTRRSRPTPHILPDLSPVPPTAGVDARGRKLETRIGSLNVFSALNRPAAVLATLSRYRYIYRDISFTPSVLTRIPSVLWHC